MKILHLIDDEKFIDTAIELFEKVGGLSNSYLLGQINEHDKLKYIKSSKILIEQIFSDQYNHIVYDHHYDLVVVHFLDYNKCKVVNNLPQDISILWLMWGGDFYNSTFFKHKLYQKYTNELLWKLKKRSIFKLILKPFIREVLGYVFPRKRLFKVVYRQAVSRINYCSTVIPTEFALLQKLPFFKAKQVFFSYGALDDMLSNDSRVRSAGNKIMIGNSNTPESNHLDVFHEIKRLNHDFDEVIVPLSYGNDEQYRDEVCKEGEKLFGEKFTPILGFLPISEYTSLLKNCKVAVFNHERQQAVGNIVIMIYLGAKVFLSKNSPVFKFYKSLGITVFSFQDEFSSANSLSLSDREVETNREILFDYYNSQVIQKKINQTFQTIGKKQEDLIF